jgi:hypothetical protein
MRVDMRSLPKNAKIFAAVAKLQGFDVLPDMDDVAALDNHLQAGGIEVQRGLASNKGVSARLYALELVRGPLFPGTQTALGNGIYFATPSVQRGAHGFQKISSVAERYAKNGIGGAIVRAIIKSTAKTIEREDLHQLFREHKNRAHSAGIRDAGAFAAAIGFDAYSCDGVYCDCDEVVWVVLNRASLIFQNIALQVSGTDARME